MFRRHTLIFVLATVAGSLANSQSFGRRANYNINTNTNQLLDEYNGGLGNEVMNSDTEISRDELYVSPNYILRGRDERILGVGSLETVGLRLGDLRIGGLRRENIGTEGSENVGLEAGRLEPVVVKSENLGSVGLENGNLEPTIVRTENLGNGGLEGGSLVPAIVTPENMGSGGLESAVLRPESIGTVVLRPEDSRVDALRPENLGTVVLVSENVGNGGLKAGALRPEGLATGGLETAGLVTGGTGTGDLGAGNTRNEVSKTGYNTLGGGIGFGFAYEGELCNNGYNLKIDRNQPDRNANNEGKTVSKEPSDNDKVSGGASSRNINYNVVLKDNRRDTSFQPYDNSVIALKDRRINSVQPPRRTYIIEREPTYVNDIQPTYVVSGQSRYLTSQQPSYVVNNKPTYVANRQPNYVVERQSPYMINQQRQAIYPMERRAYPKTPEPTNNDYDRKRLGSNKNTNFNYNYLTNRRTSLPEWSHFRRFNDEGHLSEQIPVKERRTPSYVGSGQEMYNSDRLQGRRTSNDFDRSPYFARRAFQPSEMHSQSKDNTNENDDDTAGDDTADDDDLVQFGKASLNSNSNVKTESGQNNPRRRRSIDKPVKKSDHPEHLSEAETTTVPAAKSSTDHGSVA